MKHFRRIGLISLLLAGVFVLAMSNQAMAAGTPSNTPIANSATVDYQVGLIDQDTIPSNTVTFLVDNKVDLTVANVSDATVIPGSTDQVLVYSVTNDGNTTQGYSISYTAGTRDFDMTSIRIYLDADNSGTLNGGDTLYTLGDNIADVGDDDTIQVLLVANTPSTANDGESATYNLIATTLDAGTTDETAEDTGVEDPNTVQVVFADDAGTDDAAQDGKHSAEATYTVSSAALSVVKSSEVISDGLGNVAPNAYAIPGATVRYTIEVTNNGSADATTVELVDDIPANTTYANGTITLDAVGKTDGDGDDEADYNVTNADAVTVVIPTVAVGNTSTITFDVTID